MTVRSQVTPEVPTIREVRDAIQWLRYEASNRSEKRLRELADLMEWLAHEVLDTEDVNYG